MCRELGCQSDVERMVFFSPPTQRLRDGAESWEALPSPRHTPTPLVSLGLLCWTVGSVRTSGLHHPGRVNSWSGHLCRHHSRVVKRLQGSLPSLQFQATWRLELGRSPLFSPDPDKRCEENVRKPWGRRSHTSLRKFLS